MRGRALATSVAALLASGCASTLVSPAPEAKPYADFLIGRYAERARDPAVAAARYAAALRAAPHDPALLEGAAEAALASGDAASAAEFGRRAGRAGVSTTSGRLAAAAEALREGRTREAQSFLAAIDGAPVEQLAARLIVVWAHVAEGRIDDALAELGEDAGPGRSPWTALQHYERAMALDHAGRADAALAAYARGDESGALRIAQVVVHHGQLLERTGRKDAAAALYREFLDDVDNPGVAAELERLELGTAPPRGFTTARGASVGLFALAVLLGQDPASREQIAPLALAMALDPALESPRIAFGEAMRAQRQEAIARRALAGIAPASPYHDAAQAQIAYALRAEGRDDEAVATLQAAVARGNGRMARRALADLYRNLGRNADAAPIYKGLVDDLSAPKQRDWRLFFAQGATLEALDRWPEAEVALQRALALSPDQPEVLNFLGYAWVDSGTKVREGLAILERAVAQRPDEGYIIDSLGWAHYRLGNFTQAIEYLERAVELSPGDSTLNDHLGDAYWRAGRRLEARYQWRRVLTLKGEPGEHAAAEKKLAEGLPAQ